MDTVRMQPYPLSAVRVTDAYCRNALEKELNYLFSLQEGRLLAGFYENAGLKTPYVRYGGWESGLIGGHTLGHYLKALSQAYSNASVDERDRERLLEKIKRVVDGLKECQDHSRGESGFLWGAKPLPGENVEAQFDHIERGESDLHTQAWVPYYTLHKILAGLLSAYRHTQYQPALDVASKLGDWTYNRVSKFRKSDFSIVLCVEYGGMNDALYELFSYTGKWEHAEAAHYFDEEALFDRVLRMEPNALDGLHANTTIPKFLGALRRYLVLHGQTLRGEIVDAGRYLEAAKCFWEMTVNRHAYVTGGFSESEFFGGDYVLDARRTQCNCETCNVYNLLKLSRLLFCITGEKKYTDYYDRAFVNQILSSQNPETGMTTYFQPMASGYFKVFSSPEENFWCCTGSGMENFTKIGDSFFYTNGKNVFIEQYFSSILKTEKLEMELQCDFPFRESARVLVKSAEEPFLLCFRIPDWSAGEVSALKNGVRVNLLEGNGHAALAVKEGDEVVLTIPVEISLKGLPDGKNAFAFLYGGAVLSANLGTEEMRTSCVGENVTIPEKAVPCQDVLVDDLFHLFERPSDYLKREGEKFYLESNGKRLELGLHYKRYQERYAIYLRFLENEGKLPKFEEGTLQNQKKRV